MLNKGSKITRSLVLTIATIYLIGPGAWAQTFKVLHSFNGGDGKWPLGGMVFDAHGNLYGVTQIGGSGGYCLSEGCGTVYELKPNPDGTWTESVIHAFNGSDAAFPLSSPVFDSEGKLYGSTDGQGGAGQYPDVVYQLTPASNGTWTESVLYQFSGSFDSSPGELTFDAAGNIYGITRFGGPYEAGNVYTLNRLQGWQERLLHTFGYPSDGGGGPYGAITVNADGNLYGTTLGEGAHNAGVVYRLTRQGPFSWRETVLYAFAGGADGNYPVGVTFGPDGDLYGVTLVGGNLSAAQCGLFGCGTIFKLTPNSDGTWTKTTIYAFRGAPRDGAFPEDRLMFDRAGNIYSTTHGGGNNTVCLNGCGTVFKLTPSSGGRWTESILYFFTGGSDGSYPVGTMAIDAAGNLYGTTANGGYGDGVAYEITQ